MARDKETLERRRRDREQESHARWLNGQLRHAIACAHSSSTATTQNERLHYIMGALSAHAKLDLDELSALLRGVEQKTVTP